MNEADSATTIVRLAMEMFFGLITPQAIGLLGYWRLRRARWWLKIPIVFIAPLLFFGTSVLFWNAQAAGIEAAPEGDRCD